MLDAEDDFSRFASFLADLPYRKAPPSPSELAEHDINEGNIYLFAPYFDPQLSHIERSYPGITFHGHITIPHGEVNTIQKQGNESKKMEKEAMDVPLFPRITGRDLAFPWIIDPRNLRLPDSGASGRKRPAIRLTSVTRIPLRLKVTLDR